MISSLVDVSDKSSDFDGPMQLPPCGYYGLHVYSFPGSPPCERDSVASGLTCAAS